MTLPALDAINAIGPSTFPASLSPLPSDPATDPTSSAASAAGGTTGADFANALGKGIQAVQDTQSTADNLAVQAATGDLTDIHDYTIAATQAALVTELATAIRTKGVDAFNQIMGMQV